MSDFSPLVIISVVLKGHKQFRLNGIDRVELRPGHPLHNILGTNGSGKSTLIRELFPYPSQKDNFVAGGSKVFECTYNGHHYLLTSEYASGTGKHSFVKDHGENLNRGKTYAVQKDLVFSEFGLNKDRLELLAGVSDKMKFTNMTTQKRREWLTEMCPINLDFAFRAFFKVRESKNDLDGHVKHMSQRLTRETQSLPGDNDRAHLEQHVALLTEQLNTFFKMSQSHTEMGFPSSESFELQLKRLNARAQQLLNTQVILPTGLVAESTEEAMACINTLVKERYALQSLLENETKAYQQLVSSSPQRDIVLTEEEIQRLREEQAHLTRELEASPRPAFQLFPYVNLSSHAQPFQYLDELFRDWTALINEFPDNSDAQFNPQSVNQATERHNHLQSAYTQLDNRQNRVTQRLQRLKTCEALTCPSCAHSFQPGVDPKEIASLTVEQTENTANLTTMETELAKLKQFLDDANNYRHFVDRFRHLVRRYPDFQPVWDVCIEKRVMLRQPTKYIGDVKDWYDNMHHSIVHDQTKNTLDMVSHKLRYVDAIDTVSLGQLQAKLADTEKRMAELKDQTESLSRQIVDYEQGVKQVQRYIGQLEELTVQYDAFFKATEQQTDYLKQQAIANEIRQLQLELAQAQSSLSKITVQEGILKDLQDQLSERSQEQQDIQLLLKALSPTDGLIGRYMRGFMEAVVKYMNGVINRVWTYPLEILPSKVEKEELDYRFPLNVNNGAVMPPDISEGSTAQRDIVNFTFQLLARKFLRLEHFPLYLDELGGTFDETHRITLVRLIESLIEMGHVHQIFFVSHYVSTYGAFGNADVSVLDNTNVTTPVKYNECLTLT